MANFRTSVATIERFAARSSTGNDLQMTRNIATDFLPAVASLFCQNRARRAALVGVTIVMNSVITRVFSSADFLTFWRFLSTLNWWIRNLSAAVTCQLIERNI